VGTLIELAQFQLAADAQAEQELTSANEEPVGD
jgi:hypothetical protein